MDQAITLVLLIILSRQYYLYRRDNGLMYFQRDKDVSDGCMGKMVAVGVVLFLIITLIFQKELLEAVGRKFIE